MNSKWEQIQSADEEEKMFSLLEALQKVDRAGLKAEALLLAEGCGLTTDFRKEQEHARKD